MWILGERCLYAFFRFTWSIMINAILSLRSTFCHELYICFKYLWVMNGELTHQALLCPINWISYKWNKDCKISSSVRLAVSYGASTIHVYLPCAAVLLIYLYADFVLPRALSRSFWSTVKDLVLNCLHSKIWLHQEISLRKMHSEHLIYLYKNLEGEWQNFISEKGNSKTMWVTSAYRTDLTL